MFYLLGNTRRRKKRVHLKYPSWKYQSEITEHQQVQKNPDITTNNFVSTLWLGKKNFKRIFQHLAIFFGGLQINFFDN